MWSTCSLAGAKFCCSALRNEQIGEHFAALGCCCARCLELAELSRAAQPSAALLLQQRLLARRRSGLCTMLHVLAALNGSGGRKLPEQLGDVEAMSLRAAAMPLACAPSCATCEGACLTRGVTRTDETSETEARRAVMQCSACVVARVRYKIRPNAPGPIRRTLCPSYDERGDC